MPNNFRIFDTNLLFGTAVIVTPSSEVVTLPGTNVVAGNRRKTWRSTGTLSETLTFDLGTVGTATALALISSNLGTTGTVSILAGTSNSWGAPAFTSADFTPYDNSYSGVLLFYFNAQAYRYWRFVLEAPGNTDGYIQVGAAWLGTYVASQRNFLYGWQEEVIPLSRIIYADDGTPYVDELGNYKQISMEVSNLTEGWAKTQLLPLLSNIVGKKDILLALFPERTAAEGTAIEYAANYYGKIMAAQGINNSFQRYRWPQITFRES